MHIIKFILPLCICTSVWAETGHKGHANEHGGEIYQSSSIETEWLNSNQGVGLWSNELESKVGTDQHKFVFQLETQKSESDQTEYEATALYSRFLREFWDAQIGVRYRDDRNQAEAIDAVIGIHGLAPYFFETAAYVYVGDDDYVALSIDAERDVLLTQKLIAKPYVDMNVVLNKSAKNQKKGVHEAQMGIETRYEFTKQWMPFMKIAYRYDQQYEQKHQAMYGAGIRFKF